jgi:hypothetical protein
LPDVFNVQIGKWEVNISSTPRARASSILMWLMALSASSTVWAADTTLTTDTTFSSEGYFVLSWTSGPESETPVVLEQAATENFSSPLEYTLAANGSITLTGFDDGRYFFRARQEGSPFSNTVVVEVVHHSLQRAFAFFLTGLALFLVLVVTIIKGNRDLAVNEKLPKQEWEKDNAG